MTDHERFTHGALSTSPLTDLAPDVSEIVAGGVRKALLPCEVPHLHSTMRGVG
jgi:hypothetical protein